MSERSEPRNSNIIRVGAVTYLNTRPLTVALAEIAPQAEIVYDHPSRLADALAAGRLDVATIPSIEFARHPGYSIVSDACIACDGPVRSVKLFGRVPVEDLHTIALDEGSRDQRRAGTHYVEGAVWSDPECSVAADWSVLERTLRPTRC